jgi:hypothetical protein
MPGPAPKGICDDFIDQNAWSIQGVFLEKRMSIVED